MNLIHIKWIGKPQILISRVFKIYLLNVLKINVHGNNCGKKTKNV